MFVNTFSLGVLDMRCVHKLLLYWALSSPLFPIISGSSYDEFLSQRYDAMGYDASFRSWLSDEE